MFVETIVPREDLFALVASAIPLVAHLDGGGSLEVFGLGEMALVADMGLRLSCQARLHWPALGIPIHVTVNSVTVMLRPRIVRVAEVDVLRLELAIEEADFKGLPDFVDEAIRSRVDQALRARRHELAFDFMALLRRHIVLPESVSPPSTLTIEPAWGKLRITDEAMVFVISIHVLIARGPLADLSLAPRASAPRSLERVAKRPRARSISAVALVGVGVVFGAMVASAFARRGL